MHRSILLPLMFVVVCAGTVIGYRPAGAAATTYSVSQVAGLTALGMPYGSSADRSKIAGFVSAFPEHHASLWSAGVTSDLGTVSGFASAHGHDVNDAGQVVGALATAAFGPSTGGRGFIYTGGTMSALPTLGGSSTLTTVAWGINNAGTIVGQSEARPFTHTLGNPLLTALPTPVTGDGTGSARAINSAGRIVGSVTVAGVRAPASWDAGVLSLLNAPAGATFSEARFVDDAGVVDGSANYTGFLTRGFLYDAADNAIDIGTLGPAYNYSEIFDINSSRQAVGLSRLAASPFTSEPFLYDNGVMVNLNTLLPAGSGWVLQRAFSIDDAGAIMGTGTFNGVLSGFKLTPIPEPAALAGIAVMTIAAALQRRR
jgi:probable HAF family extracellular repeat protein